MQVDLHDLERKICKSTCIINILDLYNYASILVHTFLYAVFSIFRPLWGGQTKHYQTCYFPYTSKYTFGGRLGIVHSPLHWHFWKLVSTVIPHNWRFWAWNFLWIESESIPTSKFMKCMYCRIRKNPWIRIRLFRPMYFEGRSVFFKSCT